MIQPPPLVAQRLAALGERGAAWLADLPDLMAGVAERWDLTYGEVFSGGTAAVVVAARRLTDGLDCVVKAFVPEPYDERGFERSVLTHELAGGRGCVAMLDHDPVRRVMLLERLGPDLGALGRTVPEILEAVSATLLEFWRPVPADAALPDGVYATQWLAAFITTTWEQLGQPCDRLVIDRAVAYCDERAAAYDPATAVLVHGDAHGWNTLTVPSCAGRYKFVDPEGLRSERARDLGIEKVDLDSFDLVVTLSLEAGRYLPQLADPSRHRHCPVADPMAFAGTPEETRADFRRGRDEIRAIVAAIAAGAQS